MLKRGLKLLKMVHFAFYLAYNILFHLILKPDILIEIHGFHIKPLLHHLGLLVVLLKSRLLLGLLSLILGLLQYLKIQSYLVLLRFRSL